MRTCPSCGLEEQRQRLHGREAVNLDPVSGLCVQCLVKSQGGPQAMPAAPRDWKLDQSGERDE